MDLLQWERMNARFDQLEFAVGRVAAGQTQIVTQLTTLETKIMAQFQDLQTELDALNARIAAEKQEVADKLDGLSAQIVDLQAQVEALKQGATPEQLDAVVTQLKQMETDVNSISDGMVAPVPEPVPAP